MSENSPSRIRFGVRWCLPSMFIYHLNNSTKFETTALYYDKYGRVVQSRATNHLLGYDLVYNELKFTGAPARTLKTHGINGTMPSITEIYGYTYDKAQRLTATTYSLNGGSSVILASNAYDELGRLITKKRHTSADTEAYAYNIRNWLTNINSGGFTESLYYNTNPLSSNVSFNGNISYSTWTYNNATKGYLYGYDDLNRLLSASFKQGSSSLGDDSFNENFTYDKMGNTLTLKRKKDNTLIDDLVLHYSNNEKSNQLQYVDDGGVTQGLYLIKEYQNKSNTQAEFNYDANGNLIKDLDRDIVTIQYNLLNLPDIIQFRNGNQIKNTYDASGRKLGTEYFTWVPGTNAPVVNTGDVLNISYSQGAIDQNGTVYIGNFEYNTKNGNSALTAISRIYNDEGYVETPSNPQYYYYRKDHLGDNREVWLANTGETVQRTQYYPSGLPWASNDGDNPSKQQRKYNGKEFVEMHGYDTYDYGARGMYPAIGRFMCVDPHAENNYSISPYAYCGNNLVNAIDADGQDCIITIQRDKKTNEITGVTISAKVYITGDRAKGIDKQLNAEAKNTFKANGIVKFDVNYQYVDKAPDKLDAGENVLTFSNENSNNEGGQIDNAYMNNTSNERHDGNRGTIYANGDYRSVMHETGHFLGLSDRYDMINDGWNPTYPETHPGFDFDLMNYSKNGGKLLDKIYYDQYIMRAKSVDPNVRLIKSYREIGRDKNGGLLTNPKYEKGGKHAYNSAAQ